MTYKFEKLEKTIELNADAEAVWNALVDGEKLKQWFPLDARTTPPPDGKIWCSFGGGMEWESSIDVWEPNEHLRTADEMPGDPPRKIAIDYMIESHGGTTVLRLVHSGFQKDQWDDELDSTNYGWEAFLKQLKLYLERHPKETREWPHYRHAAVTVPRAEGYARTLKALGLDGVGAAGEHFDVTTRSGDPLKGVVQVYGPPFNLTTTLENYNDGWLMVEIEGAKGGCRPCVWISLYGDAKKDAPAMQTKIEELLNGEFSRG